MRFTSENQETASKAFEPFSKNGRLVSEISKSKLGKAKKMADKAYSDRFYARKAYKLDNTSDNRSAMRKAEGRYDKRLNVEKGRKAQYKSNKADLKEFNSKYRETFSHDVKLMEHSPMKVAATNRDSTNLARIAKGKKGPFPGMKYVAADSRNMYSGLRSTGGANALILAGTLVAAGIGAAKGFSAGNKQFTSAPEDMGYSSRMSSDAIGSVSGGSRDLGATGDLVFGLNNTKKGGQL